MIVLLELLTALLEYIDLILQLSFFLQEFTLSYKYLTYYADIMLNSFRYLLCSKLCQHNRRVPKGEFIDFSMLLHKTKFPDTMAGPCPSSQWPIKQISSFAMWMEAWNLYLSVIANHNPSRALEILPYQY